MWGFRPFVAEGEYLTAVKYFRKSGRANPIERFSSADYFEWICYVETAKIHLRLAEEAFRISPDVVLQLRAYLEKGLGFAERARDVMPDYREIDPVLEDFRRLLLLY